MTARDKGSQTPQRGALKKSLSNDGDGCAGIHLKCLDLGIVCRLLYNTLKGLSCSPLQYAHGNVMHTYT